MSSNFHEVVEMDYHEDGEQEVKPIQRQKNNSMIHSYNNKNSLLTNSKDIMNILEAGQEEFPQTTMTSKRAVLNYDSVDNFQISHHNKQRSIHKVNQSLDSLLHKQNEAVHTRNDTCEQPQVLRKPSINTEKETQFVDKIMEHAEMERSEEHTVYAENYQTAPLGPNTDEENGEDKLIMINPLGRGATTPHQSQSYPRLQERIEARVSQLSWAKSPLKMSLELEGGGEVNSIQHQPQINQDSGQSNQSGRESLNQNSSSDLGNEASSSFTDESDPTITKGAASNSLDSMDLRKVDSNGQIHVSSKSKNKKKSRNMCQKYSIFNSRFYFVFQLLISVLYFVVCLVLTLFHNKNYQQIIAGNQQTLIKPSSVKEIEDFKETVGLIKTFEFLEIVLIALIIIDLLVKVISHVVLLKFESKLDNEDGGITSSYLHAELIVSKNREITISNFVVLTDVILTLVIIGLWAVYYSKNQDSTMNYLEVGVLLLGRGYMKFPILVCLYCHHKQLNMYKFQQNLIYPNKDATEFQTYKEKVLFILNAIRRQFGKRIIMNQPNYDLSWCAFVIENDYLQISNSISNPSKKGDQQDKKRKPKIDRRFSKTINTNFGQRNKNTVESMTIKRIGKLAFDCSVGAVTTSDCAQLKTYNEYFLQNNFDAYLINKNVNSNILYFQMMYCYYKFDWKNINEGQTMNEVRIKNLAFRLMQSYRNNPYHSQVHAADVVQNLAQMIEIQGVKEACDLNSFDIFITLVSGAAHDMDHPGTNNVFETKNISKLAILYNDQAVLENHHAASFFFMLDNIKLDCNIMSDFTPEQRLLARKMILENILCTDMTKHQGIQTDLKAFTEKPEEERDFKGKNKGFLLKVLVHAADIGNPTRPFELAKQWSENITKEFFGQGDKEKALGLDVTFLCDRKTTNFAKGQVGFLSFMIDPYYSLIQKVLPKVQQQVDQIKSNIETWKTLVDEYEKVMQEGNQQF